MHKKKSLIQYEMRTMSWFLLAGVLAALFFCFVLYMKLLDWHDYAYWNSEMTGTAFGSSLSNALEKGTLLAIPCLAILAIVQFSDTHRRKTQEYFHSLPFTKRERIVVKMAVGYIILTVTSLVSLIGVLILRNIFIPYIYKAIAVNPAYQVIFGNETVWHTVRSMCMLWLVLLAVYSIMIFVHTIVSKGIPASIIGIGITATPIWFWAVVRVLMSREGFDAADETVQAWNRISNYFGVLTAMGYGTRTAFVGGNSSRSDVVTAEVIYYDNFWILCLICLVVIAVCSALSYIVAGQMDMARGSILVQKRPARIFLGAGISVCFGCAAGGFFCYWFFNELIFVPAVIVALVTAVILYMICQKIFRLALR